MKKLYSCLYYLLALFFFCSTSSFSQNFTVEQIPTNENLNAANSAGQGLSMAINNDIPYLSAYSEQGNLLFIEEIANEWVFESLTGDIVQGVFYEDKYETSLIFVNNEPVIFYYDGVMGKLKYAYRDSGIWNNSEIDIDSGDDIGGFVEAISLSGGGVRLCYEDITNSNLKIAEGNIGGAFTAILVDADGGKSCSFLDENTVAYSADGVIKRADFSDNNWALTNVGINGDQPSGAINSNGSTEIYSSATKASWGNNGAPDTSLNYFYQASGGFPNTGTTDAGAYTSYHKDVGYAFRYLRYSALFGNASYVKASIKEPDGTYSYSISINDGCFGEIRHVSLKENSGKDRFIAFSYYCSTSNKQVIQLAFKEGPEEEEDDDEGDGDEEEEDDDEGDGDGDEEEDEDEDEEDDSEEDDEENDEEEDDSDEDNDEEGEDEDEDEDNDNDDSEDEDDDSEESSLSVEASKKRKTVEYLVDLDIASNDNCNLYVETSNNKRFISNKRKSLKTYSRKLESDIVSSESFFYQRSTTNNIKAVCFVRFLLECGDQEYRNSAYKVKSSKGKKGYKKSGRSNKVKNNSKFANKAKKLKRK